MISQSVRSPAMPDTGLSGFHTLKIFLAIGLITFVLRIWYAGHLYQDDGLWFTAAEQILRGKALYREIFFDKPPALPLLYAGLFKVFGVHIITIRLFTVIYSVAISAVLYRFGSFLYDSRTGLLAAAMFAVFSTTYTTGQMQALDTDFLAVLPYTAGAFLLIRSRLISARSNSAWLALAGGALSGTAFQINPKGIYDLLFFALFLCLARNWSVTGARDPMEATLDASPPEASGASVEDERGQQSRSSLASWKLFALALTGFAAASLPFLLYVAAAHSLSAYWFYVWYWGSRYASYYPIWKTVAGSLYHGLGYLSVNNTLFIGLVFVSAATLRRALQQRKPRGATGIDRDRPAGNAEVDRRFRSDALLLLWLAVSFAGVAMGGRFFAHYYFQVLPGLCLIGARGLSDIIALLRTRRMIIRRVAIWLIALGFAFTLVRFHAITVALAVDWIRGTRSQVVATWSHEALNREERLMAAAVRDLPVGTGLPVETSPPDGAEGADRLGPEAIRDGGPGLHDGRGPSDYLFIWGTRPEIYYWSGLIPASRYLSAAPLTGVPDDVQYGGQDYRTVLDDGRTAQNRAELIRDLEQTQPKYIIDNLGLYNARLTINEYPELRSFMSNYKRMGAYPQFLIYVRRDPARKEKLRASQGE